MIITEFWIVVVGGLAVIPMWTPPRRYHGRHRIGG